MASVTAVLAVVILLFGVRKVLSWQKSIPYRQPALALPIVLSSVKHYKSGGGSGGHSF